jgi:hypothetical protein
MWISVCGQLFALLLTLLILLSSLVLLALWA